MRVSREIVLPPEEATICEKKNSWFHVHVIDPDNPEEGKQSNDAPKSLASDSLHEITSLVSIETPLSPPNIIVEESPHNVIHISAAESPPDHQQEGFLEIPEDTPTCIQFSEIDTSTSGFEEFMRQSSCPLVTKKTMATIQIDTPPRVTIVVQTRTTSPSPLTATTGELVVLPPWLSYFTPKRKK